jgi:hypothetical protein
MNPSESTPAENPNHDTIPRTSTSALGGAKEIMNRFEAFRAAEAEGGKETKPEAPEKAAAPQKAANGTETKQEASSEKKADGLLPPEKGLQKAPESKAEAKGDKKDQSTEEKRGSDGLTKTERAELVKFKERAEAAEAKLGEHELTRKEAEELRAYKETAEAKVKELEERSKIYEAKATAFDVTASPHYQKTIHEPMVTLTKGMEALCEQKKLDADAVFAAIANPDESVGNEALSEFLASLDTFTSNKFQRMVNDMRDLDRKGQELIAKSPEAWSAIQAEQTRQAEAQKTKDKETYEIAGKALIPAWQERFPFITPEMGEEIRKEALTVDFDKLPPASKATYAQALAVTTRMNAALQAKDAEIERLKKAIKDDLPPGPNDTETSHQPKEQAKKLDDDAYANLTTGQRLQMEFGGR